MYINVFDIKNLWWLIYYKTEPNPTIYSFNNNANAYYHMHTYTPKYMRALTDIAEKFIARKKLL